MRGRGLREKIRLLAVVGTAATAVAIGGRDTASADTLEWALVQAYQNNPSLNAQRAALRAADENSAAGAVRLSAEAQRHCLGRL